MKINGNTLRDAFISGSANISNNRTHIDELNVFPVPDGDTGTNMSMTIGSSVRELSKLEDQPAGAVAATAASCFLRGARGNSGVILSLLFRGISKGLKGLDEVDGPAFTNALGLGVEAAYKAVMKPTEGTILTVARVAHETAKEAAKEDFLEAFKSALEGAKTALASTPELLPVLKKAGVVDAGGQGLITIFEGMLSVFEGNGIIEAADAEGAAKPVEKKAGNAAGSLETDITFTYCTEYIVNRDKSKSTDPLRLRAYLESIGDCAVVVDDEDIIKVHVHTDHPGKAIEKALEYGQLVNMKIENMRDQHERAKHDAQNGEQQAAEPAEIEKPYGFVSVCVGEGLEGLFTDLGADKLVSGGQTMNPSTEDILNAIEQVPAETVYVLPNNKNIIMAAELAIPLASRKVVVLHTRTVPMGISAMLAFDPDADEETNTIAMTKAADRISTGQITYAARQSDFEGHKIKQGDILAMDNGKLAFTDTDFIHAAVKLTQKMCKKDSEIVTLIYGSDVTEEQAGKVESALSAKLSSDIEVTTVYGGQPIYYFIISVE